MTIEGLIARVASEPEVSTSQGFVEQLPSLASVTEVGESLGIKS